MYPLINTHYPLLAQSFKCDNRPSRGDYHFWITPFFLPKIFWPKFFWPKIFWPNFWQKIFLNKIFFDHFSTKIFFRSRIFLTKFFFTIWRITQLIDSGISDYHFYSALPTDIQLGYPLCRLSKSDNHPSPHLLTVFWYFCR